MVAQAPLPQTPLCLAWQKQAPYWHFAQGQAGRPITVCLSAAHRHLRGSARPEQTLTARLHPATTLPARHERRPRLKQISRGGLRMCSPARSGGGTLKRRSPSAKMMLSGLTSRCTTPAACSACASGAGKSTR